MFNNRHLLYRQPPQAGETLFTNKASSPLGRQPPQTGESPTGFVTDTCGPSLTPASRGITNLFCKPKLWIPANPRKQGNHSKFKSIILIEINAIDKITKLYSQQQLFSTVLTQPLAHLQSHGTRLNPKITCQPRLVYLYLLATLSRCIAR